MREILKERLSRGDLPLIGSLRGGGVLGKDNSMEGVLEALKYQPDIIELDIRISSDGILYCFHGSIPFGVFIAKFCLKFLEFNKIKKIIPSISSLADVLSRITVEADVFLDIKDSTIESHHIIAALKNSRYSGQIWIGSSLNNLIKLRVGLGERVIYYLNYYSPIGFSNLVRELKGHVDIVEIPEYLASSGHIKIIKSAGIIPQVSSFKDTDRRKIYLTAKYGNICLDLRDIRMKNSLETRYFHETF